MAHAAGHHRIELLSIDRMLDSLADKRVLNVLPSQVPPIGHRDVCRWVENLQVQFRDRSQALQLDRSSSPFADDPIALAGFGSHHHRGWVAIERAVDQSVQQRRAAEVVRVRAVDDILVGDVFLDHERPGPNRLCRRKVRFLKTQDTTLVRPPLVLGHLAQDMLGHNPDSAGDLVNPDHAVITRHLEDDGVVIGRADAADSIRFALVELFVADDVVPKAAIGCIDHQRVRYDPTVVEQHILGCEGSAIMPFHIGSQMEDDIVAVEFPALGELRHVLRNVLVQLHQSAEDGAALVEMLAARTADKARQMGMARGLDEADLKCAPTFHLFHWG